MNRATAETTCPKCQALAGATCRAPSGHTTDIHTARRVAWLEQTWGSAAKSA